MNATPSKLEQAMAEALAWFERMHISAKAPSDYIDVLFVSRSDMLASLEVNNDDTFFITLTMLRGAVHFDFYWDGKNEEWMVLRYHRATPAEALAQCVTSIEQHLASLMDLGDNYRPSRVSHAKSIMLEVEKLKLLRQRL